MNTSREAQQIVSEYNERIMSLINNINANSRTNNQISVYEEDNVANLETIKSGLLYLYYGLAVYVMMLLWVGANELGMAKKVVLTIIIPLYPYIILPLLKWLVGWARWLWGLMPYYVNANLRAV
jgi:hypothetical protein